MENQNEHYRHILLFYFRKGKTASQAHKKLCAVYGDAALKERQCHNWFAKFRSSNFSLNNEKRSGRPVEVDVEQIKALIDAYPHSTTREIAELLQVSHTCIEKRLKQLGYVREHSKWVPHNEISRESIDVKEEPMEEASIEYVSNVADIPASKKKRKNGEAEDTEETSNADVTNGNREALEEQLDKWVTHDEISRESIEVKEEPI